MEGGMIQQRDAVLRLLRDDDPATVELVKDQIARDGIDALPDLRELLATADRQAARPLREVIAAIERESADEIFERLCVEFEEGDLEEAVWRLAATFLPGEDFQPQRDRLDQWAAEVQRRFRKATTLLDRIETVVEYLGDEVGLRGNDEDYYNINNSLLPEVIDSRLGIPVTLSLVYLFVGRRCGLEFAGVGLPGHFLIRYREHFFDPFHGGRRIGLADCRALVEQQNLELTPAHLEPTTERQMLIRMLTNIHALAADRDPELGSKVRAWAGILHTGRQ
jgi:regulator of sirC expression with transglutaminase-like and TPR domain